MLRFVLIAGLMMTAPVAALEAPDGMAVQVAAQVRECWNLLPSERDPENIVILDLALDAAGAVDGMPKIVKAPKGVKVAMAKAGQIAALACAPYKFKDFDYTGTVRITLVP